MSQTCRSFRQIAQTQYVPKCMYLSDFEQYQRLDGGIIVDARVGILQSLLRYSWKRMCLKELHCNWSSVLGFSRSDRDWRREMHEGIRLLLRTFLATPEEMPSALPSLKTICLCNCFNHDRDVMQPGVWMYDYSTEVLRQFFMSLQTPLESISLMGLCSMSDTHVEAFLPIVGKYLTRLELTRCHYAEHGLTDRSALCIARHCTNLESFAMVESNITAAGLQHVLMNNPHIVSLDLSNSTQLDTSVVAVISRYLPKIRKIRNYWAIGTWLTDDSLIALVDALSKNPGGMCLDLIGLQSEDTLTARGLDYAIGKGLKEIEVDHLGRISELLLGSSEVTVTEPLYSYNMDGSSCGASSIEWM